MVSDIDETMNRVPNWVRWILVLPGAVASALLVLFLYQVLFLVERFFDAFAPLGWIDLIFIGPTAFGVAAAAFVTTGAGIAPCGRRTVAVLLALVPTTFVVLNVYIRLRGDQDPAWPTWRMALEFVGLALGLVFALGNVFEHCRERSATVR